MRNVRNWIIGSGVLLFLAFGGKAVVTGHDVPEGMRGLLVVVFTAGLGIEPLTAAAGKVLQKKKEGEKT